VPIGKTPVRIRNHPALKGVDLSATGGTGNSIQMVMGDVLVQTSEDLRGEAESDDKGNALLHARDKRTGQILKSVALPMPGQYGMMTFMHGGKQYLVVQSGSARRNQPGSLVALTLP
jgi:glucose dehydrogenase